MPEVFIRSTVIQIHLPERRLVEPYGEHMYVVQNPPSKPLSQTGDGRDLCSYPYMRTYHPSYEKDGGVPAISEVKFSLISNRGCFGGCNFCALTFHQGRIIQTRSHESLLEEAEHITQDKDFKGYIHDVGGPTADFRHPSCEKQLTIWSLQDTGSVCSRHLARTLKRITKIMYRFSGNCGRFQK